MSRVHAAADVRRNQITAALIELSAEVDPCSITTSQIAARMGVSHSAIFRHVPTKQSMWDAALEWTSLELNRRFDELDSAAPMARLEAMFQAHLAFVVENPGVPRILFGELQRFETTPAKNAVGRLLGGYRMRVAEELERARELEQLPASTDVVSASIMFLAMVQGLVMQGVIANDLAGMSERGMRLLALFRTAIGFQP